MGTFLDRNFTFSLMLPCWYIIIFIMFFSKMYKNKKFIVFMIMFITSIISSFIIICFALSFTIHIFIPMIMIGIGFLTGTLLLIKSEKKHY